jgi:hypothetical protein
MIPIEYLKSSQLRLIKYFLPILTLVFGVRAMAQTTAPCTASAGTLGELKVCVNKDSAQIEAKQIASAVVPNGFARTYLLAQGDQNRVIGRSSIPFFKVKAQGRYAIHTLVYNPANLNPDTLFPPKTYRVNQLYRRFVQGGGAVCAAIDTLGAKFSFNECDTCKAYAGTLKPTLPVCLDNGTARLIATHLDVPFVPAKFKVMYILTRGPNLVMDQFAANPDFIVRRTGRFTIHTLVYDPTKLNLSEFDLEDDPDTLGVLNKLLIQGGGKICGALDLVGAKYEVNFCPCPAAPGAIAADNEPCLQDGTAALRIKRLTAATLPEGFQILYVLTRSDSLIIVQTSTSANPTFNVTRAGRYRVHTLVYNPVNLSLGFVVPGTTPASEVNRRLIQGGGVICGALDLFGAVFNVAECPCVAKPAVLRAIEPLCYNRVDSVQLRAEITTAAVVPEGFRQVYVLTRGDDLTVIRVSANPVFRVAQVGTYRIHNVVYKSGEFSPGAIVLGTTKGADIAKLFRPTGNLCGGIDVTGARFVVAECPCTAATGTLTAQTPGCYDNVNPLTIRATVGTAATVPSGFQVRYVLTSGDALEILGIASNPQFNVTRVGRFRIHTLVYNPATLDLTGLTQANQVRQRLIQGGGTICGALDFNGVVFDITGCPCTAKAGTLNTGEGFCFKDGSARLRATHATLPTRPEGFLTRYVLTRTDGLIIEQIKDVADFTVTATGRYRIHTLVYNPSTLNVGTIQLGTTTAAAVNGLLIQGGGTICGALDVAGALFEVANCPQTCGADPGTLRTANGPCLDEWWDARLRAAHDKNPTVPSGFVVRYLVSRGANMTITQIGDKADFIVGNTGRWRIHTLVYNPSTFNISQITLNTTTIAQLKDLLARGIVPTCAGLDETGAIFDVDVCEGCRVEAGTLKVLDQTCISNSSNARIRAAVNTAPVSPTGFVVRYVLSTGDNMVIRAVANNPDFTVSATGQYRIHTLVYHPNLFDPAIDIVLGTTTVAGLKGRFVQGGGYLCAAIDKAGAFFDVTNCSPTCGVDAGVMTPSEPACLDNWWDARLRAKFTTNPTIPSGYTIRYLLVRDNDGVILGLNSTADFTVSTEGKYRILPLVYHPNTLNITIFLGRTKVSEITKLLIGGGGVICGELDLTGAFFDVKPCTTCTVSPGSWKAVPGFCLNNDWDAVLEATVVNNPIRPSGFEIRYILTSGSNKLVEMVGTSPKFNVTKTGIYRIHAFVYNPNTFNLTWIKNRITTIDNIKGLITGSICAAIDHEGVYFDVDPCAPTCRAESGTLKPKAPVCIRDWETVTLEAVVGEIAPVIPTGFQIRYVLTSGDNFVIRAISNTPRFDVSSVGTYRIHALVYNPNTLSLGAVVFGSTRAGDINKLLIDGGGTICGDLDESGALFEVKLCSKICGADPGELVPVGSWCLDNWWDARLRATHPAGKSPVVPANFARRYLLSMNGVILQVSNVADFAVNKGGLYTIHTLIYDPNTLRLDLILVPGTTTVAQIVSKITGNVCAGFDEEGLQYDVKPCFVCNATFGKITVDQIECLPNSGTAWVKAKTQTNPVVPSGYVVRYILSQGAGLTIRDIKTEPAFGVTQSGTYRIHTVVYNASELNLSSFTSISQINAKLAQGGGTLCGALDVNGLEVAVLACTPTCTAEAGTLKGDLIECLPSGGGAAWIGAKHVNPRTVPANSKTTYLLVSGNSILQIAAEPKFGVTQSGTYKILTLVAPNSFNVGNYNTVTGLKAGLEGICDDLDEIGATIAVTACTPTCTAEAGTLTGDLLECLPGVGTAAWIGAKHVINPVVPANSKITYLLVSGNSILQINNMTKFGVTQTGSYKILGLVAPNAFSVGSYGTLTGLKAALVGICADLDEVGATIAVTACTPTCTAEAGSLTGDLLECLPGNGGAAWIGAKHVIARVIPANSKATYLLVSGNTILQVSTDPKFGVTQSGSYKILTLIAPNSINASNYNTLTGLKAALVGICADLDEVGASISVTACTPTCTAEAGSLKSDIVDCLPNAGGAWVNAKHVINPTAASGFLVRYLLVSNNTIVNTNNLPKFFVSLSGTYRIVTIVYNPNTFNPANYTTLSSLVTGISGVCGDVDQTGVNVVVTACTTNCGASAGTLVAELKECLPVGGAAWISAKHVTNPILPEGYIRRYLLVSNGNILQVNTEPLFGASQLGTYSVHTVIYSSATLNPSNYGKLEDLRKALIQGGGTICGALDVTGASIVVVACTPTCNPNAGKLTGDIKECVPNNGGSAWFSAKHTTQPFVPTGFLVRYLLVNGNSILQRDDEPSFSVSLANTYKILTLVFNPSTLNWLNYNTVSGLNAALIQGGGTICAALDVNGAEIAITACTPPACTATPGTLMGELKECLPVGGAAWIGAKHVTNPTIPQGFVVRYLMVSNGNILQVNTEPKFGATQVGTYSIHTVVYNPTTLNPSNYGKLEDLRKVLIQGGGTICGALDVTGTSIVVMTCTQNCTSAVGTLRINEYACLAPNGELAISASVATPSTVPTNFSVRYILTKGDNLVVQDYATTPSFSVEATGTYRIHVLVYNPATFPLTNLVIGVTQLGNIRSTFIEGGGSICASLGLAGVRYDITTCQQTCFAEAGTLAAASPLCFANLPTTVKAIQGTTAPTVPNGFQLTYLLTSTANKIIVQRSNTPSFVVNAAGTYRIHAFVYNPATFNINTISLGTTTISALQTALTGKCADLDDVGVSFTHSKCCIDLGDITVPQVPCIQNRCAWVKAKWVRQPEVPKNWRVRYLLVSADKGIVESLYDKPQFWLCKSGRYSLHVLIYNPLEYDPAKALVVGKTKVGDVERTFDGECAGFDEEGYVFNILACTGCPISPAMLEQKDYPCVRPGTITRISAIVRGSHGHPSNLIPLYVLTTATDSLKMLQVNTKPEFDVPPGMYRIHLVIAHERYPIEEMVAKGLGLYRVIEDFRMGGGTWCGLVELTTEDTRVWVCMNAAPTEGTDAFPNPTSDKVQLQFKNPKQVTAAGIKVEVLDLNGSPLRMEKFEAGATQGEIDIQNLPKGMYMIRILREGQQPELLRINKM